MRAGRARGNSVPPVYRRLTRNAAPATQRKLRKEKAISLIWGIRRQVLRRVAKARRNVRSALIARRLVDRART